MLVILKGSSVWGVGRIIFSHVLAANQYVQSRYTTDESTKRANIGSFSAKLPNLRHVNQNWRFAAAQWPGPIFFYCPGPFAGAGQRGGAGESPCRSPCAAETLAGDSVLVELRWKPTLGHKQQAGGFRWKLYPGAATCWRFHGSSSTGYRGKKLTEWQVIRLKQWKIIEMEAFG